MKQRIGTRSKVMHGIAKRTSGGLRKQDLLYNNKGKIVSKNEYDGKEGKKVRKSCI